MFAEVLLFLLITASIILIVLSYTVLVPQRQENSASQSLDKLVTTSGWSATSAAADGSLKIDGQEYTGLNVCRIYSTLNEDKVNVVQTPSDAVSDLPTDRQCLTDYSKALILSERTCLVDTCIGQDGTVYSKGGVETYFTACGNLKKCTNTDRRTLTYNFVTNVSGTNVILVSDPTCLSYNGVSLESVGCSSKVVPSEELFYLDKSDLGGGAFLTTVRSPSSNTCLASNLQFALCTTITGAGQVWLYTPQYNFAPIGQGIIAASLSYSPSIPDYINFAPQTTNDYSNLQQFLLGLKKINSNGNLVNQSMSSTGDIYVLTPHVWSIVGT